MNDLEYCVRMVNFPVTVKGVTVMDETGFYNIYINSRLDFETQKETLAHELTHIRRGDFFSDESLEDVESM